MILSYIPNHIQAITVDLWGTLFFDNTKTGKLYNKRAEFIDRIQRLHGDYEVSAAEIVLEEKKEFQLYENNGIILPIEERIRFLTRQTISKTEIIVVKSILMLCLWVIFQHLITSCFVHWDIGKQSNLKLLCFLILDLSVHLLLENI